MRESIIQTTINKFLTWLAKKSVTALYKQTHFWTYSWGLDENTDLYLISEESYLDRHRFGVHEEKYDDTPQTDCDTCKHYKLACELFSEVCKYEPTTQTETQNSNLTFEKRTMLDCYNCKRYETEDECIECHFEPKADTPQTEVYDYKGNGKWERSE